MSEFDSLFKSVWEGDAPAEGLADWILERVDDLDWLPVDARPHEWPYAQHQFPAYENETETAYLIVKRESVQLTELFCLGFGIIDLDIRADKRFTRTELRDDFKKWLTEQIDFLYYILSK